MNPLRLKFIFVTIFFQYISAIYLKLFKKEGLCKIKNKKFGHIRDLLAQLRQYCYRCWN